jgi:hypothetical protein
MPAKAKSKLKVRIPIPKPTRFHSTLKGKKGYDRKRLKRENAFLRRIIARDLSRRS